MLYKEKPSNINNWLKVAACFIEYNEKILFLRRPKTHKFHSTWIEPGGKINKGETSEEAMIREVFEESGIIVNKGSALVIGEKYFHFDDTDIYITFFHYKLKKKPNITLHPKEADRYMWVSPSEALNLNLIDDLDELLNIFFKESKQ